MGDTKTRKSAVIRALTGAHKRGVYDVATSLGVLNVYVQISSLQEDNITPAKFVREHLKDENVLIPLWIKGRGKFPDGDVYLARFLQAGWYISGLVILGVKNVKIKIPNGVPNPVYFPNSKVEPANKTANSIRKLWGWL